MSTGLISNTTVEDLEPGQFLVSIHKKLPGDARDDGLTIYGMSVVTSDSSEHPMAYRQDPWELIAILRRTADYYEQQERNRRPTTTEAL